MIYGQDDVLAVVSNCRSALLNLFSVALLIYSHLLVLCNTCQGFGQEDIEVTKKKKGGEESCFIVLIVEKKITKSIWLTVTRHKYCKSFS